MQNDAIAVHLALLVEGFENQRIEHALKGLADVCSSRWRKPMKLTYVINFVGNMDRAVAFHRDTLGLPLTFSSPGWSEFATGETRLGLHPASEKNPPGTVELGFGVPDLQKFYEEMSARASSSPCRQQSRISAGCWRALWTRKAAM